jgi:hypothetical protein
MPRHLNANDEIEIQHDGVALPTRKYIKFDGDGIDSVTDDDVNDRTVVTVAPSGGGGLSGGYKGFRQYTGGPYTISNLSGSYVNAGTLASSGGDQSWFDATYSIPSSSDWYFAEHGLYRYSLAVVFTASASLGLSSQFGLKADVFTGTQKYARDYYVTTGVRIHASHPTDANTIWRGYLSITDYFGPGDDPGESGIINTQFVKYVSMPGVSNVYTETWISRLL